MGWAHKARHPALSIFYLVGSAFTGQLDFGELSKCLWFCFTDLLPSRSVISRDPQTPILQTKYRARVVTCKSAAEQEAEELEKLQQWVLRACLRKASKACLFAFGLWGQQLLFPFSCWLCRLCSSHCDWGGGCGGALEHNLVKVQSRSASSRT